MSPGPYRPESLGASSNLCTELPDQAMACFTPDGAVEVPRDILAATEMPSKVVLQGGDPQGLQLVVFSTTDL